MDSKETLSLQQCEDMLRNYLATGSGKDYLLSLMKFQNVYKQMHHAANQLFKEILDGVLLPNTTLTAADVS